MRTARPGAFSSIPLTTLDDGRDALQCDAVPSKVRCAARRQSAWETSVASAPPINSGSCASASHQACNTNQPASTSAAGISDAKLGVSVVDTAADVSFPATVAFGDKVVSNGLDTL